MIMVLPNSRQHRAGFKSDFKRTRCWLEVGLGVCLFADGLLKGGV